MRSCCPSMSKAEMKILEAERLHQPMTTSANTVPKVSLQQKQKRWLSYTRRGKKVYWITAASEISLVQYLWLCSLFVKWVWGTIGTQRPWLVRKCLSQIHHQKLYIFQSVKIQINTNGRTDTKQSLTQFRKGTDGTGRHRCVRPPSFW